ncbi:hypothetical protein HPHPA5_1558 [Helicobacter pylori Hp A-5]|nr:hypothetical protein HPHPA5_1558 [Helicobacter pylori Hp A-5]
MVIKNTKKDFSSTLPKKIKSSKKRNLKQRELKQMVQNKPLKGSSKKRVQKNPPKKKRV